MSRSRRKTPISGMTSAESDAQWKAAAARALRHRVKQQLSKELDTNDFPGKRWDLVNPWSSSKDGKGWFGDRHPKLMRK